MLVVCRGISLGGPGSSAADALDLTVSTGEVCTIVGSSGSGKSRLCRLLSGTERPGRGEIIIDGRSAGDHPNKIRQRVTHVVPDAPLWPGQSMISNVEYVLRLCALPRVSKDEIIGALRLAELPDRLFGVPVGVLSLFQRYTVWLAIHRLRQTRVILLDDPFVKLTGWETESLARLVHEAADGGACAVITSGSADVPAVAAERRYRIARGRLLPILTPTSWLDDDADITTLLSSTPAQ